MSSRSHLPLSEVFMHLTQDTAIPGLFVGFISFMLCISIQRHPRAPLSYWACRPIYHLSLRLDSSECLLRNSTRPSYESLKKKKSLKVDCFRKFTSTSKCGVRHNKKSTFKGLSEPERRGRGKITHSGEPLRCTEYREKIRKEKERKTTEFVVVWF